MIAGSPVEGSDQESPVLAGAPSHSKPLPFLKYIQAMRHDSIAGFHDSLYQDWIIESNRWRLRSFIVNDPEAIKHILVDHADNYIKGRMDQRILHVWPGKSWGASDVNEWSRRRKTMSPSFDYRSLPENFSITLDATQGALSRWSALPAGSVIEVSAEMAKITIEVISRIVFSSDSSEFSRILERVSSLSQGESNFDLLDFVPLLDRPWGAYKRRKLSFIFNELHEALDRLAAKRTAEGTHSGNDFLERLLRENPKGNDANVDEVFTQIAAILGAGHESVALALMWIWYLLSQHPQHEARFHAELDDVLGGVIPTLNDLARLPYTRMIIDESLRMYPPFHTMAWREALADDEICGVKIPKGTTLYIVPWLLHRHAGLWDHPERFEPERFSPERSRGRSRFAYLPFGTGPRVCIGASFAVTETMLILVILAQRFRLRVAPGHKVETQGLITLKARYGMKMILENRL